VLAKVKSSPSVCPNTLFDDVVDDRKMIDATRNMTALDVSFFKFICPYPIKDNTINCWHNIL